MKKCSSHGKKGAAISVSKSLPQKSSICRYQLHAASGSFIRRNAQDFCYERSQPPTPQSQFEMKL